MMKERTLALSALCCGLVLGVVLLVALDSRGSLGRQVKDDPLGVLTRSADRVAGLHDPCNVGFLGEIVTGDAAQNCSGSATLQTGEEGLRVYVFDCTVGDGEGAQTFSVYLSPTAAALSAPERLGEGWHGLRLAEPLAGQAAGTAYETALSDAEWAEAQQAADDLRGSLTAVTALDLRREWSALLDYLAQAEAVGEESETGYRLRFTRTDAAAAAALGEAWGLPAELLGEAPELEFGLTQRGGLNAVSVTGDALTLELQLGDDPERELLPRVEAAWTDGAGMSHEVTMALTLADAEAVTEPAYDNIFPLLAGE